MKAAFLEVYFPEQVTHLPLILLLSNRVLLFPNSLNCSPIGTRRDECAIKWKALVFMQEMELEDVSYSLENEQQFWVGELPSPLPFS